jgi:hypothetical protein
VPPPRSPAKPDIWTSIANLRSPAAIAARLTTHVSPQATASRFGDDDEPHL